MRIGLRRTIPIVLTIAVFAAVGAAQSLPVVDPSVVGLNKSRLGLIDDAVENSIRNGDTPGAVVLVGRYGKIAYRKAYGNRSVSPKTEPMTVDTVFDLASLTKPFATATSIMILVQDGKLRLSDPIGKFVPEIEDERARKVSVEQLLIHVGGYRPDFDLREKWIGRAGMLDALKREKLRNEPGESFVYSDIGFIVLGEIVERVSGKPLDVFVSENQFKGLADTGFRRRNANPSSLADVSRIAPTENICGQQSYLGGEPSSDCATQQIIRGDVHDPTSWRMDNVAGHAGLFSTVDDLAELCDMFLRDGMLRGRRVLSEATIAEMRRPRKAAAAGFRALGWDVETRFSSNRGDLFPFGSFGHTGFTGTSVWMDPASGVFVVFLSNRVHPDGKGNVTDIRGKVANIVASSIMSGKPKRTNGAIRESGAVLNGIDVLEAERFERLKGLKVGLVTNQTGRNLKGLPTIDILAAATNFKLVCLFSPEHGIRGELDQAKINDSVDEKTGLPVYSLYGETRRPLPSQLKGLDALVFDIQDIGTRFYTYISTLRYVLEEASKAKIKVYVLDRPNPINGVDFGGPIADENKLSFVSAHTIPVRHGMTVGEIAMMMNRERGIDAEVSVVEMKGWSRSMWFDETGQTWINPSPNMRNLNEALLYPGIGLLETTNLSVGRGTDTPFEVIGAPWLDARVMSASLNKMSLAGVRFVPIWFTPKSSVFEKTQCGGVNIVITDREAFNPLKTGFAIAAWLRQAYPNDWKYEKYDRLLANGRIMKLIEQGDVSVGFYELTEDGREQFGLRRSGYLIY
ncbi:MAG: DUF1343 domain-containing protein [Pyrinomonadaceae bacterium]